MIAKLQEKLLESIWQARNGEKEIMADMICPICGNISHLSERCCDDCAIEAQKIVLAHEGNITDEQVMEIMLNAKN